MVEHLDKAKPPRGAAGAGAPAPLRSLLAFLRRNLALLLVWPLIALAAGTGLWWHVLHGLEGELHERQAELVQQVDAYTRSYAIRTRRSIGDTDRMLLLLRHNWAVSGHHAKLEGTLEQGIFSRQYVAAVGLINAKGEVETSSHPAAAGRNVRQQPYFTAHQGTGIDRLYVSAPLTSQLTDQEVIAFSRPLLSREGRFDGIVLASMLPSFFTQHYAEPILRGYGFVGLAGDDGAVRASRSGSTVHAARTPFLLGPMPADKPEGVIRLEGRRWFADGRARVVGWQRMPELGLSAIVGVDEYSAMAGYRHDRQAAISNAWWNTAWLTLAALLATSFYVHAKWKQHQIEAIRSTYRLATEDAGEGFFINRPLRDRQGRVCDFEIVDSNQHGADMFGKQPHELIGHRLSEFYRGELFEAACARLRSALETGLYDRELPVDAVPDQLL